MMKDNSWVKLFRKMESWEWFSDSKTVHVFVYLLIRANIKSARWNGRTIKRGQVVTSYGKIAAATGMSISSAKRAVANLVSTGEIKVEPTNRYNLITVVKYAEYQSQYSSSDTIDSEQSKKQTTEPSTEPLVKKNRRRERTNKSERKPERKSKQKSEQKPEEKLDTDKSTHDDKTYVPRYFEFDLKIPERYYGKFSNADEWWNFVEQHREEVERAYEL